MKKGSTESHDRKETGRRPKGAPRALDPFFLFCYTLLALAGIFQVILIVWMDIR